MTYGHLQADCLYTGISSGPNARYRVWEAFTFTFTISKVSILEQADEGIVGSQLIDRHGLFSRTTWVSKHQKG